jgi:hypothetical protein
MRRDNSRAGDKGPSRTIMPNLAQMKARIADSSSTNAVSFSSACTIKRLPSSRCASAIQIVRPSESRAETQPQLHPALLRLSAKRIASGVPWLAQSQWSATQLINWQMFIIWPLPVGPEIILPCGSNTRVNSPTSNRSPNDGSAAAPRPVTVTMVLPF